MRLDRDINGTGKGKYGLVNNRKLQELIGKVGNSRNAATMGEADMMQIREAVQLLERAGVIDWGFVGTESEFFVLKLRDFWADDALHRYSLSAAQSGEHDYARAINELAERAGVNSPFCKRPD